MTTENSEQERDPPSEDPPKKHEVADEDIDEALEESFPASDPPAY